MLIDLDGVIRDWVTGLILTYKEFYPDHEIKAINSRFIQNSFPIGKEIEQFIKENNEQLILNAPPYPDSLESLNYWSKKYDLVIVTSQEDYAIHDTMNWIDRYQLPVKDVVITFNKEKVSGIALLDDFVYNLEKFSENGGLSVCFDQPWNKEWNGLRVKTLYEYFTLIENRKCK